MRNFDAISYNSTIFKIVLKLDQLIPQFHFTMRLLIKNTFLHRKLLKSIATHLIFLVINNPIGRNGDKKVAKKERLASITIIKVGNAIKMRYFLKKKQRDNDTEK